MGGLQRWGMMLALTVVSAGAGLAAPAVKEEKPKPPDWSAIFKLHYENRVRAFREQNQQFQHVVLLGDSITEGFEAPKYFPGRRVLNRGISGDVIGNGLPPDDPRGVLRRLDNSSTTAPPRTCSC